MTGAVAMRMIVAVIVVMVVRDGMVVRMIVVVIMRMPVMLAVHLLCKCVIFGEAFVVPMPMTTAIGAGFRLERQRRMLDVCTEPLQHVFEYRVRFERQRIDADFDRCMTIAEVISGACEREAIWRGDA